MSRRGFLIAGGIASAAALATGVAGYELIENNALPGKTRLNTALGACGQPVPPPNVAPGPVVSGSFTSAARRGIAVGWSVAYPPGYTSNAVLPVCLALHGGSESHTWAFGPMALQYFLASIVDRGVTQPFAIASMDGGDAVDWHHRANGDDPQQMITSELLPILARRGLKTERIGLYGVSLGGYGALLLATALGPQRVAAVAASSPAIWKTFAETQPGRYDNEAANTPTIYSHDRRCLTESQSASIAEALTRSHPTSRNLSTLCPPDQREAWPRDATHSLLDPSSNKRTELYRHSHCAIAKDPEASPAEAKACQFSVQVDPIRVEAGIARHGRIKLTHVLKQMIDICRIDL